MGECGKEECVGECGEEGCVWVSAGRRDVCGCEEEGCVGESGEEGCVWVSVGRRDVCVCVCCMQTCISACVCLEEGVGLGGITHS